MSEDRSSEARVIAALNRLMSSGELRPGNSIRQDALAQAAGVSRVPVRQVLARLDAEGLVRLIPNQGAYIKEFSTSELKSLHAVRSLLEDEALRLAVKNLDERDLEAIEKHLVAVESAIEAGDALGVSEQNHRFHEEILGLSGNSYLTDYISRAWKITTPYRAAYLRNRDAWERVTIEHREIYAALCDRDEAKLQRVAREHRDRFLTDLLPWLRPTDA